jgi:hypothetical protein
MGLFEIMTAVRNLSSDEQALVIKHTVDILRADESGLPPELEELLERRWNQHLAAPSKSRPAREVLAEMMKEASAK